MPKALRRKPLGKRQLELVGKITTAACGAVVILLVFTIIFLVVSRGLRTFTVDGQSLWAFLSGTSWLPEGGGIGALPMIVGSFAVTLLSTLFTAPLAIGAGIFIVEISPRFGRRVLQPVIELLVGIPSVVYGLIGLLVIVPFMRDTFGGTGYGILSASLVLMVMILPTVASLSTDAISSVPDGYRLGAKSLGATRWQMIHRVVLRSALPGILTALVLGMARAFGEALAVQMIVGNSAVMPTSLLTPASTLTSILTMGMGNTVTGSLQNDVLWSLALVLLAMSLVFILIVHLIGSRNKTEAAQ